MVKQSNKPLGKIPEQNAKRRAWFRNAFAEWKKQMKSGLTSQQAGEHLGIPRDVTDRWSREMSVGIPGSGRRRNGFKFQTEETPKLTSDELWNRYLSSKPGSKEADELRAQLRVSEVSVVPLEVDDDE